MTKTQGNMRELLSRIGVGQFNATMIINSMFMAPATTDPKSAAIILLVTNIQRKLNQLGAGLKVTGYLDVATANVLTQVVGQGWESRSWGDNVSSIVNATSRQKMFAPELGDPVNTPAPLPKKAVGFFDPPFLPSVPGGIVTYAIAGAVAYHFWKKR